MKPRVRKITLLGEPVLRKRSASLRAITPREQRLIDDMLVTMKKARGVGIAAPQIGVGQRLFIVAPGPSVRYPHAPFLPPLAMINPRLLTHSSAVENDWEGCLSIPGIRARVPRWRSIEIEFTARNGRKIRARLKGFVARIFQHEFDHINGKVYLDRVRDTRTFMVEREYRLKLRGKKKSAR